MYQCSNEIDHLLHGTNRKSHGAEFWFVVKVSKIISRFSATLSAIGCMYERMCTWLYACVYVCMNECMYDSMYVCMYVRMALLCVQSCRFCYFFMYACMYECTSVCMDGWMSVCLDVRMYVCMCSERERNRTVAQTGVESRDRENESEWEREGKCWKDRGGIERDREWQRRTHRENECVCVCEGEKWRAGGRHCVCVHERERVREEKRTSERASERERNMERKRERERERQTVATTGAEYLPPCHWFSQNSHCLLRSWHDRVAVPLRTLVCEKWMRVRAVPPGVCVRVCVWVCVCVCVCERERESVCVCVREREWERK